jgi:hypothetical protein
MIYLMHLGCHYSTITNKYEAEKGSFHLLSSTLEDLGYDMILGRLKTRI